MSRRVTCLLALILSSASVLPAATASLSVAIAASNGDTAALAEITITERATSLTRTLTADAKGAFSTDLPPGTYNVTAISWRTRATAHATLELHSGEKATLALQITGGWTVFEVAQPTNALDALAQGSEITRGEQGGNVEGFGPASTRGNFGVNSIGQRSQDNNFQLDGLDNNDPWLRGPILNPSPDGISAASLTAVYTPATEGHQAGAVVNSITNSGTAAWHGTAFDYLRNSALNARNFFDGSTKPGTTSNQFGATGGGPVTKNSWFVFADIDALRARDGLTVISTVPTFPEESGTFTTPIYDPVSITQSDIVTFIRQPFANNQVPLSHILGTMWDLIALYPTPNLPGLANNYRYTPSSIDKAEHYAIRTDKTISPRDRIFARLNYERNNTASPSALPGNAASDSMQHADNADIRLTALGAAASQTFELRPGILSEIRVGITHSTWTGTPTSVTTTAAGVPIAGLAPGNLPIFSPEGYAQLGSAQGLPGAMNSTSYELKDTVAFTKGRHNLVAGFQMLRRHLDGNAADFTSLGTFSFTPDYTDQPNTPYTGNSIASLLLGDPNEIRQDIQLQNYQLRGWELAGFAQDTLRIGARLIVTAGLRYSYDPPVTEASNRMVNFNYSRTNPAANQFAGVGGVNAYGGLSFNKRTIAPRIGFALDIGSDGATVLRGGFSQDYDPGSYMAEGMLARNAPYESQLDYYNGSLQPGQPMGAGLVSYKPLAIQSAINAIEPKSYTPYADQWGLYLDRRLSQHLTAELSGTGSMGIHLYETYNINQPFPAPTPYPYERYPFPSTPDLRIQYLGFAAGSTYYGGEAKLTGQVRHDLRILATYRYAKSIDDATQPETPQASRPSGPQYIYNLRGDRSASPFDVPQRLIVTAAYDLPFHVQFDALVTLQSGFPFTPQLAINGLNNGAYQLPNRVGTGALPANRQSATQWFNTSLTGPTAAFTVPALFQYGNSGFDIVRGPGLSSVDMSLSRTFSLRERMRLQTRIEATNLFNRTNLALPNAILGLDSSGTISHTATPSRNMQLVAKLIW